MASFFLPASISKCGWSTGFMNPAKRYKKVCAPWPPCIASKSPLSVRGVKEMITYARDHTVADGLNYIATWNAAMLMSNDLQESMMANMGKRGAVFND
jgi:enoyl-CoA hydratase/carnithine racemase